MSEYEYYQIVEYNNYTEIIPIDNNYKYCMFFFAGFNEVANSYSYLFKSFLEKLTSKANNKKPLPIKIVLPNLIRYDKKDLKPSYARKKSRFDYYLAWYIFKMNNNRNDYIEFIYNEDKNNEIIEMVNKEINKLGSSENIILSGFSMGGRYALVILDLMKIKTLVNICFKCPARLFVNDLKNNRNNSYNDNVFYYYYSINDKVITYSTAVNTIRLMKGEFNKDNVHVKVDMSKKHAVDEMCLSYIEGIFRKYLKLGEIMMVKF